MAKRWVGRAGRWEGGSPTGSRRTKACRTPERHCRRRRRRRPWLHHLCPPCRLCHHRPYRPCRRHPCHRCRPCRRRACSSHRRRTTESAASLAAAAGATAARERPAPVLPTATWSGAAPWRRRPVCDGAKNTGRVHRAKNTVISSDNVRWRCPLEVITSLTAAARRTARVGAQRDEDNLEVPWARLTRCALSR